MKLEREEYGVIEYIIENGMQLGEDNAVMQCNWKCQYLNHLEM